MDGAHGRGKRREQHIGRDDTCLCQSIEESRFAGVCIADQRRDRIRHAFAAFTMQLASPLDLFEIALDSSNALFDHPAIGFDLSLTRSAEKAEAAPLSLEVRP